MRYIKDGLISTIDDIRILFPNISMPDDANLDDLGYTKIEATPYAQPGDGEISERGEPEEYELGKWRETWVVKPEPAPQTVSRLQAKAALLQAGLLDAVQAMVNHPDTDRLVQLAWAEALEFNRTSPAILGMASAMGWTDTQLDELFKAAHQIEI